MGKFNIKDLFISEDPTKIKIPANTSVPVEESVKTVKGNYFSKGASVPQANFVPVIESAKIDEKFYKAFEKVLEDNDFPGYDYFEFRKTLLSLREEIDDEKTQFTAALATASSMKATPDKLIETANQYINLLNGEKNKFEEEMKEIVLENKNNKSELTKINTQLDELKNKKETLEKEIAKNDSAITNSKQLFNNTLQSITDEISQDILKIGRYSLKGGSKTKKK